MANEIRGALCEAVVVAALELVRSPYRARLLWGTTPSGLQVCESDITIFRGRSLDGIVQVTSSGYAGNYQMKFWRDLGELFEIRRVYPEIAIINVIFESETKRKLVDILRNITDGVVEITNLTCGRKLVDTIGSLSRSNKYIAAKNAERLDLIKSEIQPESLKQLADALGRALSNQRAVWNIQHKPATKVSEPTINLRRAFLIGRLFCDKADGFLQAKYIFDSAQTSTTIPASKTMLDCYCKLGLCKKVIGGVRITSVDLLAALNEFGVSGYIEKAGVIFGGATTSRIDVYVKIIQNLDTLTAAWYKTLHENLNDFCDSGFLEAALSRNFGDYSYLLPKGITSYEPWIFRRILDVIRASREKHFCIGVPTFDALFRRSGMQPLRFTISEYLAGRATLNAKSIAIIARTLSKELQKERAFFRVDNRERFFAEVARSELTQRLYAYRGINPAQSLLKKYYKVDIGTLVPAILADLGITGAGGCKAELSNGVLSLVQNASQGGVGHKVNEVVGRAGLLSLRLTHSNGGKKFFFDPKIVERVLYVDGSWRAKDLKAVASGAFTKIVSLA